MTAHHAHRVTWLGHATVLIETGGARLLTDPVLRDRVLHLQRQVADACASGPARRRADLAPAPRSPRQAVAARARAPRPWPPSAPRSTWPPVGHGARGPRRASTVDVGGATVRGRPRLARRPPPARARRRRSSTRSATSIDGIWFAGDTDLDPEMEALRGARRRRADPDLGLGPVARSRASRPRRRRAGDRRSIAAADRDARSTGARSFRSALGRRHAAAAHRARRCSSPPPSPRAAERRASSSSRRRSSSCSLLAELREPPEMRWTASAPTTGSSGHSRSGGCSTNGCAWPPPMPPCEPTSSSNAATSSRSVPVGAVDHDVRAVREARRCGATCAAAFGPNGASGSSPSTCRRASSAARRAEHDRAVSERRARTDPRVRAQRVDQAGRARPRSARAWPGPGSRGNVISPRLPEAITETSGIPRSARARPAACRARCGTIVAGRACRASANSRRRSALKRGAALVAVRVLGAHLAAADGAARCPRAPRRSAAGTSRPGSGRGRRARRAGTAAGRAATASAIRAIARSTRRSTASVSGRSSPEWCATSS